MKDEQGVVDLKLRRRWEVVREQMDKASAVEREEQTGGRQGKLTLQVTTAAFSPLHIVVLSERSFANRVISRIPTFFTWWSSSINDSLWATTS